MGKRIKAEASKMVTISIKHITTETAVFLYRETQAPSGNLPVYQKENRGFFIYTDDIQKQGIPGDLWECVNFAKNLGCFVLCLDSDGPEVYGMTIYECD